MPNREHLETIKRGVITWNTWRRAKPEVRPDLSRANLEWADLSSANLSYCDLSAANLRRANLTSADLNGADLNDADGSMADLSDANLNDAILSAADFASADMKRVNLRGATLNDTDLSHANLCGADASRARLRSAQLSDANLVNINFTGANLIQANLTGAELSGANLREAHLFQTTFGNNDLSTVEGLETVHHIGPSSIGVDTLYKSDGKIPALFLRGAGFPEDLITFLPSLLTIRAIEFSSCFISYSHQDEGFSQRLYSRMRDENLRVWYAPEDMKGGRKLHEEIFRAIQLHDKLLVVLSQNSMKSEWVRTEIRRARRVEREEHRRKLFPIRLVDFDEIEKWECFDADSGKDLAVELREYYIPDFSNWKNHDTFESEFAKLLRDLRATKPS